MKKTGIFTPPDLTLDNLECVRQAASVGQKAFEPFARNDLAAPDADAAARIHREAERLGVALPCFSMAADLSAEGAVDRLKAYVDLAAQMGVPMLHHTLYPELRADAVLPPFEALLECVAARAREVYDYGASRGVQCVYEDQGFCFNGCERFERFLNALERPAGVVLDLGNTAFCGENADDFARRFAHRVVHVHVKDYAVQDKPSEGCYALPNGTFLKPVLLGEGAARIRECLKILHECGYDGWLMLECEPMQSPYEAQRRNLRTLGAWLDEL